MKELIKRLVECADFESAYSKLSDDEIYNLSEHFGVDTRHKMVDLENAVYSQFLVLRSINSDN